MKNKHILALTSALILTIMSVMSGQGTVAPDSGVNSFESPVVTDEYILMPGDSVIITVSGATNYSYITGITYDGKAMINMPVTTILTQEGVYEPRHDIVEAVPVYQLNLKAARDSLKKVFRKYFRNIDIDITLLVMRTFSVIVVGEVKYPGIVKAKPIDRVSSVIAQAGGTTTLGSRSKIELKRNGALYRTVNLEKFDKTGDGSVNPYVQDADIIFIAKMLKSVIVKGAVFGKRGYELRVSQLTAAMERTSEGLYELDEGERISDFITKAGGLTPWADHKNAYVERAGSRIPIDLTAVLSDEASPTNIELKDNDIIVIPSINAIVYVQGQVVTPSAFPYQPNLKASDYIGLAGGPLDDANYSGSFVIRGKKRISVRKDPVIEQGDRIYVPRQIFKFWQDYVAITSVAASLLISYLTLRTVKTAP
jgi:protein involved in polysaccharide export with SLBB domain